MSGHRDDRDAGAPDEMDAWGAQGAVLAISPPVFFLDHVQILLIQGQAPEARCGALA
jgi:hypothetical protein